MKLASIKTKQDKDIIDDIQVRIDQEYDTTGKPFFKYKVSDDSGSCYLTVFSKTNPPINVGELVKFSSVASSKGKTGLSVNLYNGNYNITASDKVMIHSATEDPTPANVNENTVNPNPHVSNQEPKSYDYHEYSSAYVELVTIALAKLQKKFESSPLDTDQMIKIATSCASSFPAFWFGEKGINK